MASAQKLGRPVASAVARGEERLENWANWALAFSPGLGYPQRTTFARLYKPDAGDVWEGIEPDEVQPVIDEDDAVRVEAFVRALDGMRKRVVRVHYLGKVNTTVGAKRVGLSRQQYTAVLDDIAKWVADA